MKHVILVRHAKAGWNDIAAGDFDRPLTDKGKQDAQAMAKRVFEKRLEINSFISSPAKRARTTASFFLKQYGVNKDHLILKTELYLPSLSVFYNVIENCDDTVQNLALFSHNSGITDFANALTESFRIDDIPTCGIVVFQVNTNSWKLFRNSDKRFIFFDYPSMYW